jgi:hypothetical protein
VQMALRTIWVKRKGLGQMADKSTPKKRQTVSGVKNRLVQGLLTRARVAIRPGVGCGKNADVRTTTAGPCQTP